MATVRCDWFVFSACCAACQHLCVCVCVHGCERWCFFFHTFPKQRSARVLAQLQWQAVCVSECASAAADGRPNSRVTCPFAHTRSMLACSRRRVAAVRHFAFAGGPYSSVVLLTLTLVWISHFLSLSFSLLQPPLPILSRSFALL